MSLPAVLRPYVLDGEPFRDDGRCQIYEVREGAVSCMGKTCWGKRRAMHARALVLVPFRTCPRGLLPVVWVLHLEAGPAAFVCPECADELVGFIAKNQ